jgi:hypothetical protein
MKIPLSDNLNLSKLMKIPFIKNSGLSRILPKTDKIASTPGTVKYI